jgi:plastocyanin
LALRHIYGGLSLVLAVGAAGTWLAGCSAPARAASNDPPATQQAPAGANPPAGGGSSAPSVPADSQASDSQAADSQAAGSSAAETPSASAPDSGYLKWDAATKTVTFRLVAGPFMFNGYASGGATLTVPPGSANVWTFVQDDGTPHSAEVASGKGPLPNSGGEPVIPRAYTNKLVEGLVQGSTDVLRFTAPDTGSYRIICGVPGHALSGMWIWLKIDPAAKAPSFGPTPK